MLKIDGTTIYLTCGDSAAFAISAKDSSGESYTFQVGDKVQFALKKTKNKTDTDVLICKTTTVAVASTTVTITLNPEDTEDLQFDKYYYDIQLTKNGGWIDTIIENSIFKVGVEIG